MAVRGRWPPFGSKGFSHPSLLSTAKQVALPGRGRRLHTRDDRHRTVRFRTDDD